jgi:NAD(P)-dependent dehydrogenase (short-subunit alcohol dehydrogenase family)
MTTQTGSGRVAGRTAIVTGAANGIGAATAAVLYREGANVVVADMDGAAAEVHAKSLDATGERAIGVEVDISDPAAVQAMVDTAVAAFGGISILHNNAGPMLLTPQDTSLVDTPLEIFDAIVAVNLRGSMLCTRAAMPHLIASGDASVTFTASGQALSGDMRQTAYGASKAALIQLSRSVATQYGRQGVRSNCIVPGLIITDRIAGKLGDAEIERLTRHQLTTRRGSPYDIAETVLFLATAPFITGQMFVIDGGMGAHHPSYAEGGAFSGKPAEG